MNTTMMMNCLRIAIMGNKGSSNPSPNVLHRQDPR